LSVFADDAVAEVRARADIVEVIGEAVVLKRSGRNFTGLCPFHQERTPSFNVNPEKQIFRCFGCGEGGDVFSFVMKSQHQTFPEALKGLADRYGIQLPDRRPDDDERTHMREVNDQAASFYQQMLANEEFGAKARAYLQDRGVGPDLQKKFGLGFAPGQWDSLHRYLLGQKVPTPLQESAALVRPRGSGSGHYDYFRNRIMFPIHNEASQVVGFGARAIDPGDEPKYLNSPETLLYRKGNLLYGLNQARDAIKARDSAVLMEGYMDVIMAHAYGFNHAVGVLGTALTPAQARILLRYTPGKRVVIAFDADRAGQVAAERGLATLTDVTQGV
jgi:DNA primase